MASEDTQFKPGQSGNPKGGAREKVFLKHLMMAITQDDAKRVRQAADQLLSQAAAGEQWAIQMLAERLDGKASQAITGDDGGPILFEKIKRVIVDGLAGQEQQA